MQEREAFDGPGIDEVAVADRVVEIGLDPGIGKLVQRDHECRVVAAAQHHRAGRNQGGNKDGMAFFHGSWSREVGEYLRRNGDFLRGRAGSRRPENDEIMAEGPSFTDSGETFAGESGRLHRIADAPEAKRR